MRFAYRSRAAGTGKNDLVPNRLDGVKTEPRRAMVCAVKRVGATSGTSAHGRQMLGAVMPTKILVAEDVDVYRDTLVAILELEEDLQVVASLTSGDRIVPVALDRAPDVAVLDIDLPGMDGLTAAVMLRERLPACRVLILTGIVVVDIGSRIRASGVAALLSKAAPAKDIVAAIRRVARGGFVDETGGLWSG